MGGDMWELILAYVKKPFQGVVIGDTSRVATEREEAEQLFPNEENRAWKEMLASHPGMERIKRQYLPILFRVGVFSLVYLVLCAAGLNLPKTHWAYDVHLFLNLFLIGFAGYTGYWYHRVRADALKEFTRRYGSHYHLG